MNPVLPAPVIIGVDLAKGKDWTALKIILPFPPSVNGMFAQNKHNAKHRFKTKAYKDWLDSCPKLTEFKISGQCTISYMIFFPDDRIRDGQNYMKAPLDYLCAEGVIEDDNRRIVKGEQWVDGGIDKENPRLVITIKELKNETEVKTA